MFIIYHVAYVDIPEKMQELHPGSVESNVEMIAVETSTRPVSPQPKEVLNNESYSSEEELHSAESNVEMIAAENSVRPKVLNDKSDFSEMVTGKLMDKSLATGPVNPSSISSPVDDDFKFEEEYQQNEEISCYSSANENSTNLYVTSNRSLSVEAY